MVVGGESILGTPTRSLERVWDSKRRPPHCKLDVKQTAIFCFVQSAPYNVLKITKCSETICDAKMTSGGTAWFSALVMTK